MTICYLIYGAICTVANSSKFAWHRGCFMVIIRIYVKYVPQQCVWTKCWLLTCGINYLVGMLYTF